jgi:hypothetical protein
MYSLHGVHLGVGGQKSTLGVSKCQVHEHFVLCAIVYAGLHMLAL